MRRVVVYAAVLLAWALSTVTADAGDKLKAGWTSKALEAASAECTDSLVQGTWENAQRKEDGDATAPITSEFRKEHASEIAAMKKLCGCAVREAAKRYTRDEAEANPADLERAASESISAGTCKLTP